jgi:hypothetical protein
VPGLSGACDEREAAGELRERLGYLTAGGPIWPSAVRGSSGARWRREGLRHFGIEERRDVETSSARSSSEGQCGYRKEDLLAECVRDHTAAVARRPQV